MKYYRIDSRRLRLIDYWRFSPNVLVFVILAVMKLLRIRIPDNSALPWPEHLLRYADAAVPSFFHTQTRELLEQARTLGMVDLMIYGEGMIGANESVSAVMRSVQGDTFLSIEVARSRVGSTAIDNCMWSLNSVLQGGQVLRTTAGHVPVKLPPEFCNEVLLRRSLPEVLERHVERLREATSPPRMIADELDLEALVLEHEQRLFRLGIDRRFFTPISDDEVERLRKLTATRPAVIEPPVTPAAPAPAAPSLGFEFVFWLLLFFGGFLMLRGSGNQSQTIFRGSLLAVGILGIVISQIIKMLRRAN